MGGVFEPLGGFDAGYSRGFVVMNIGGSIGSYHMMGHNI